MHSERVEIHSKVKRWNRLPREVAVSQNLEALKRCVDVALRGVV